MGLSNAQIIKAAKVLSIEEGSKTKTLDTFDIECLRRAGISVEEFQREFNAVDSGPVYADEAFEINLAVFKQRVNTATQLTSGTEELGARI